MILDTVLLGKVAISLFGALAMSFISTPIVKSFANKVGAIDVPKDNTRMHKVPIPRQGGLAIFLGFILSVLLFAELTQQIQSILLGTVLIVIIGAIDDIVDLKWWIKAVVQIAAALLVSVWGGVLLERFSNPFFGLGLGPQYFEFGVWAVPITVIWIVAVTNSVNFIDGLDGLAVGVSGIASATMLVTALIVSDGNTAIVMAALAGACIGFIPYNLNPAKIFMGDCGALLLGFVLATMSLLGLFKEYTLISFGVPFIILGIPIFDEVFAVFRRLAKGQKPWARDRGHLHHRLIDMGLTQKQAVAICYAASTVLGVMAVVLTADGGIKMFIYGLVIVITAGVAIANFRNAHKDKGNDDGDESD